MDWRTSDVEKRTPTAIDDGVAAHTGDGGSLAIAAVGDFAPAGARVRLGPALIGELQVARRAGQRFGLSE